MAMRAGDLSRAFGVPLVTVWGAGEAVEAGRGIHSPSRGRGENLDPELLEVEAQGLLDEGLDVARRLGILTDAAQGDPRRAAANGVKRQRAVAAHGSRRTASERGVRG